METQTQTPTMRRVIWGKMIEAAQERSLGEIASFILKPCLVVALASCMLTNGKSFDSIMQWRNFSVPMVFTAIVLVYGIPILYRITVETGENIIERTRRPVVVQSGERLEGALTGELIDHLFETQSFKRNDVEARFKMPRHRVSLLADRLEDVGILCRGENNARVLAPISRAEVEKILEGKRTAEQVEIEVNIVRPTPPLPIFQKRMVSQLA